MLFITVNGPKECNPRSAKFIKESFARGCETVTYSDPREALELYGYMRRKKVVAVFDRTEKVATNPELLSVPEWAAKASHVVVVAEKGRPYWHFNICHLPALVSQ